MNKHTLETADDLASALSIAPRNNERFLVGDRALTTGQAARNFDDLADEMALGALVTWVTNLDLGV